MKRTAVREARQYDNPEMILMQRQNGFTLIELITVIVILGVLAVVALPRYINLQDEAEEAATDGVGGSLGAAAATNLAGALAGDTASAVSVASCPDVAGALADGLPNGYRISTTAVSGDLSSGSIGVPATCELQGPGSNTANFTGYRVP